MLTDMPEPLPTQLSGAMFLASRKTGLLADAPRVGKTGAAIIAADYNLAESILVITTSSGRPVWSRAFADWSPYGRSTQIVTDAKRLKADVAIVGWGGIANPQMRGELLKRKWDLVIADESHNAKNFEAKRTRALYGEMSNDGQFLSNKTGVIHAGNAAWCLSGTPLPNSPFDVYPMMRALCPDRLAADDDKGWPDVSRESAFKKRYCVIKPKKIGNWRWIDVVIGGRNLEELRERIGDFMLLRTQADVGIRAPIFETLPLLVSDKVRREADAGVDTKLILAAASAGDTKTLEMHLGPLRRLTGEIKARAVVEAVKDEFDSGLDKIVLMAWHKEAMQILRDGLAVYGVVGIDGSTPANRRGEAEQRFLNDPKIRVFIGQIQAAGEAIDLSSSATLWFVETSFVPKDMAQAAMRITNHTQTRQAVVRVCVLDGSIDDALQQILMRKWTAIRGVLSNGN